MQGSRLVILTIVVLAVLSIGYVVYTNRLGGETQSFPEEDKIVEKALEVMEGTESAARLEDLNVTLNPQNDSKQAGTATIEEFDGKTKVTIKLAGAPKGSSEPAHIHVGACPTPGDVKYPLNNVVDGISETEIDVAMKDLEGMLPLAINVHKSAQDLKTYVACGDIRF